MTPQTLQERTDVAPALQRPSTFPAGAAPEPESSRVDDPALSPAILNVVMIAAVLFICPHLGASPEQQIFGLA